MTRDKKNYQDLKKKIQKLERESSRLRQIKKELMEKQTTLRNQNINLVKKSIELSDIKRELEDKNYELEMIRSQLRNENIRIIQKSIELSDIMRELEDKNYDLKQSQSELEAAMTALRESEQKYANMVLESPDPIISLDHKGHFLSFNPIAEQLSGFKLDEVLGKHFTQVNILTRESFPKALKEFTMILSGKDRPPFELTILRKDKNLLFMEANPRLITQHKKKPIVQVIFRDITDRKKAEEEKTKLEKQLRRAQKLETIGTLAGGIAHDFNNILTPILGYTDIVLSSLNPSDPLFEDLQHVMAGANRAKDLVQQILTFSRQIEQKHRPLKLHLLVKEAIKLLRPSIPSIIEIREQIDSACEEIQADPSQMHQVLVNLCTNGFHSMEQKGGVLTIEMKQVRVDRATAQFHPNLKQKEYVRLTVSDTGTGMDETTLDRIFEPFFTTKDIDKGTGLGLSVVHGIVRSHQGDIIVYSKPGKGSTFHVYLPVMKTAAEAGKKKPQKIKGGSESILVVDDEELVIDVLVKMLEHLGYKVSASESGLKALKTFHHRPDKFDLVISDLTMPDMTGLELVKQLHKVRSDLPVIIMTGFGESVTGDILDHYGISAVIGKPIELQKLGAEIRKIFNNK
jgi:PAS domain S-box-containing protein